MIFDADDEIIRGYYEEDKLKSAEKRRCQAVRVRISSCYDIYYYIIILCFVKEKRLYLYIAPRMVDSEYIMWYINFSGQACPLIEYGGIYSEA